jgi:hypothetical protein
MSKTLVPVQTSNNDKNQGKQNKKRNWMILNCWLFIFYLIFF